jgi:uncharacterized protein (DUF362 family)
MNRRDFLKAVAGTGFYLAAKSLFPDQVFQKYDVGIAKGSSRERAVEEAINLIGGIRRFVKPGDVVSVKPNIGFNSPPALKANTDPVVVRTVVHLCFQALASKVYVFDRAANNPRLTYVNSGIAEAAEQAGAKVLNVNDVTKRMYRKISIPDAQVLKNSSVNRYVLESDVFINVPVAKVHSSAGLTIALKNLMGVTGDNRSKWHWKLHESISDFSLGVKTHLTVVDATSIMIKNGPTGGRMEYLKRLDTIIASADILSADATTAELFGIDPSRIGYMALAQEKGIGKLKGYTVGRVAV